MNTIFQRTAHSAQRTATAAAVSAAFCLTFFSPEMARGQGHWGGGAGTGSSINRTGQVLIGTAGPSTCASLQNKLELLGQMNLLPMPGFPLISENCTTLFHTNGSNCLFSGYNTGDLAGNGTFNTAFGHNSYSSNTSSSYSSCFGAGAGRLSITQTSHNTYLGALSGEYNDSSHNVAIGANAMRAGNFNRDNVMIGSSAGEFAIGVYASVLIGKEAGYNLREPGNVLIGHQSGFNSTFANENVFVGYETGWQNLTGKANTFLGHLSGRMQTTQTGNTFIGVAAAANYDLGIGWNTAVGASTVVDNNIDYSSCFGYNSRVCASNTIVIGSNSPLGGGGTAGDEFVVIGACQSVFAANPGELEVVGRDIWANGWSSPSDRRLKKNIQKIDSALYKLSRISGYTYDFKSGEELGFGMPTGKQTGIIAQELEGVFTYPLKKGGNDYYGVDYTKLIPLLIEGIKEQQQQIQSLTSVVEALVNATSGDSSKISEDQLPKEGYLKQNTPNPHSGKTTIEFEIKIPYSSGSIDVYDLRGNTARSISFRSGETTSVVLDMGGLKTGLYTYALKVEGRTLDVKTMILSGN